MILLLDNFDSFVYNLARMFEELGHETLVVRNDAIDVDAAFALGPQAIVISPGPCDPPAAGISLEIVRQLGERVPTLGVCLGHQVIAAAYGGEIVRGAPVHGRATRIHHSDGGIFRSIPSPFLAARYHSLVVSKERLPLEIEITAQSDEGTVMALRHSSHPLWGIQFHPESILTEYGYQLLGNFLELSGASVDMASLKGAFPAPSSGPAASEKSAPLHRRPPP